MRVRLFKDVFSSRWRDLDLPCGSSALEILGMLGMPEDGVVIQTPDGVLSRDSYSSPLDHPCIWIHPIPRGASVVAGIFASLVVSLVVGGVTYGLMMSRLGSLGNTPKISSAASLRGSANTARPGQRLPVVLGRRRVVPDLAAQVYSSYEGHDQFLHQLFCFGYSGVVVDETSLKIGTTPVSRYSDITYASDAGGIAEIYPRRCIETSVGLELDDEPIVRSTASGTVRVRIGIAAPSGLYEYDDDEKVPVRLGLRIEYKPTGSGSWSTSYEASQMVVADVWRWSHEIALPYSSSTYDIRVTRTTPKSEGSSVIDYVYWDVLTCFTQDGEGNVFPIRNPESYSLLALKARATGQLNGIVDSLSAYATLRTRRFDGKAWMVGETRNPAAAVLYLLTDRAVNPRPVDDARIDWESFEAFHAWCDEEGFTCDAQITGDFTIEELCTLICQSSLATLVIRPSLISVRLDRTSGEAVQMFTPRNAAEISMTRSFEDVPDILKCRFECEDVDYAEVERTIRLEDDGSISYDTEVGDDEEATEVTLAGVTKADHAAHVMAVRLRQMHTQRRSYSWRTDLEGLVCLPGDVVLLATDSLLYGLGEGRVVSKAGSSITLDSELTFAEGMSYGIEHRRADGTLVRHSVVNPQPGTTSTIGVQDASSFSIGDLVSFGYWRQETHRVQVVSISVDGDKTCTIQAVDYDESVFDDSDTIPPYDPGISLYPEGVDIGQGRHDAPDAPSAPSRPPQVHVPIAQYAWGQSQSVPPASRIWVWRRKFFIWGGRFVGTPKTIWSSIRTEKPKGGLWYRWIRWSMDGGATWEEPQCIAGNDAQDFTIEGDGRFAISSRGELVENIVLSFRVNRINDLYGECTWSIDSSAASAGVLVSSAADECTVTIFAGCEVLEFTLRATIGDLVRRVEITGQRQGAAHRKYLGVYPQTGSDGQLVDKPTSTDEGPLMTGDSITYVTSEGTDVYFYIDKATGWTNDLKNPAVSGMLFEIAMDSRYDVESMAADPTQPKQPIYQGAAWVLVRNLAAVNAFIESVFAKAIMIQEGGSIYSGAYDRNGNNDSGGKGTYIGWDGTLKAIEAYFIRAIVYGSFFCADENGTIMQTSLGVTGGTYPCSPKTRWSFDEYLRLHSGGGDVMLDGVSGTMKRFSCVLGKEETPETVTITIPYTDSYRFTVNLSRIPGGGSQAAWATVNGNRIFGYAFSSDNLQETHAYSTTLNAGDVVVLGKNENKRTGYATISLDPVRDSLCFIPSGSNVASYVLYLDDRYFLEMHMTASDFDSDDHKDFAPVTGWLEGTGKVDSISACPIGQKIVMDGDELGVLYLVRRADGLDMMLQSGKLVSFDLPDGSALATSGYYDISGSITFLKTNRGMYVDNIMPIRDQSTIGNSGEGGRFLSGFFEVVDALSLTGSLTGNVNSEETRGTYKVWGAVAN